jgi:hypothetical protein
MKEGKTKLTIVLTVGIVAALFGVSVLPTVAQPTATNFGVDDTQGYTSTYVEVPLNITNVQSGPVITVIFDIAYDTAVITVVDVQKGSLTSLWDSPSTKNFAWGTRVSLVYDGQQAHALQNGSTGSIALLNLSVVGESGDTSTMDLTTIQLAGGPPNYLLGTAPAQNGTFTVLAYGSITGYITDSTGAGIDGVTVNLTRVSPSVQRTTTTNETGYYSFSTVDIGDYCLNYSKSRYWANSSTLTIESSETETTDMTLWKKGDLNNNGIAADAGDLAMMKDASVGNIPTEVTYDLNTNGICAGAGDLAMMKDASVGNIELL